MSRKTWSPNITNIARQYTGCHASVFVLTFCSCAFFHASRKTFSNVKTTMTAEWTYPAGNNTTGPLDRWNQRRLFKSHDGAEEFMGTLDACFLFAFALGLYVTGFIADRNDLRLVLCTGMALTSLAVFIFGCLFEWLHFYSQPAYLVVWILNGLLQSSGWPAVVAMMDNWFGHGSRGLIMGLWSACASVGNIISALLVSTVLDYGYDYAFLLTSSLLMAGAVINLLGLVPTPLDVGLPLPEEDHEDSNAEDEKIVTSTSSHVELDNLDNGISNQAMSDHLNNEISNKPISDDRENGIRKQAISDHLDSGINKQAVSDRLDSQTHQSKGSEANGDRMTPPATSKQQDKQSPVLDQTVTYNTEDIRPKAINFLTALLLPGVLPYALCEAFLKLVNYSFLFWLPFYLSNAYSMPESTAVKLSIWFDIGGVVGGTAGGFLSDRLKKRTIVLVAMLLAALPMLFVYGLLGIADSLLSNGALLFILGCFIGGAANLISSAVSADLGRQKAVRGNAEALSTVTGILDGTGSLGAAVGQVAVPHLQIALGWHSVFYLFMISISMTILCVSRLFYREVTGLCRKRNVMCKG